VCGRKEEERKKKKKRERESQSRMAEEETKQVIGRSTVHALHHTRAPKLGSSVGRGGRARQVLPTEHQIGKTTHG
jgi:hypothetical protein